MVPVEFLGRARAFRSALVADHDAAILMAGRLTQPFLIRHRLRQPPTAGALAGLAKGWRDRVPSGGRLDLVIDATRSRVSVDEIRCAPSKFAFCTWGDDASEPALAIMRATFTVSTNSFESNSLRMASVSLHALARRYQRGWNVTDTAIRADLCALAAPRPDRPTVYGELAVLLSDGQWVGSIAEIDDHDEPVRIFAVRSYIGADMSVREDAAAFVDAHP